MKQSKYWKRNIIMLVIVLFVCGAVYLNWSYNRPDSAVGKTLGEAALVGTTETDTEDGNTTENEDSEESSYFAQARLNRQQARDSAMSLLQEAASDEKADQMTIEEANLSIQTMANQTLTEAQIENLVVAKGYTNCVAFLNDASISVVVSGVEGDLGEVDVAKIGEIVMEQTGLSSEQIKIIPTN